MTVDTVLEDDRWAGIALESLADRACGAVLDYAGLDTAICEISLLACDDARIAGLNGTFRGKPQPTNVLSWPETDLAADSPGGQPLAPEADATGALALGDIAIAYETCSREASEGGKSLADHAVHLLVHGTLHLLGYDHERDDDATLMERIEVTILGRLGLDNPYKALDGSEGPISDKDR